MLFNEFTQNNRCGILSSVCFAKLFQQTTIREKFDIFISAIPYVQIFEAHKDSH